MTAFNRVANQKELNTLSMILVGQAGWFSNVSLARNEEGDYLFTWAFDGEQRDLDFSDFERGMMDVMMPRFPGLLDEDSKDFGDLLNLVMSFYVGGAQS